MHSQLAAFASGIPPDIYGFHSYTRNSNFLSRTQVNQFELQHSVEPNDFIIRLIYHLRISLRPIIPDNVCTLRITDASGT